MMPFYSIPVPTPQSGDDWDALADLPGDRASEDIGDLNRSHSGIISLSKHKPKPKDEKPPRPVACIITRFRDRHGEYVTVIARQWHPDVIPQRRCKLCPECKGVEPGLCQVAMPGYVRRKDAAMANLAAPPPSCPPRA